jgi:hypothetical protein
VRGPVTVARDRRGDDVAELLAGDRPDWRATAVAVGIWVWWSAGRVLLAVLRTD